MKKVLISFIVLVALFISGCSDTGILRITNWSSQLAWYILGGNEYWLDGGYYIEHEWDLSTSIFGDEEKNVSVQIGGEYIFNEVISRTVKPGSTVKIDIDTNAGEIIIWNDSYSFYITEVYLSPSSDPYWGSNDLSGTIGPGQWVSWYVTPGWWDILVVDDWGDEFYSFDNYISIEYTLWFYYDGFKSGGDPVQLKLENAAKYTEQTKDRVQQNEKK